MSDQVVLAFASAPQEAIWSAALGAHAVTVSSVPPSAHLETELTRVARDDASPLFLIDLAVLAQLRMSAQSFTHWKSANCPQARLIFYCSTLHVVPAQARAWAHTLGAGDLLSGCCVARWRESLLPALQLVLKQIGARSDEATTTTAMAALPATLDNAALIPKVWEKVSALAQAAGSPDDLVARLRDPGTFDIGDHRFRTRRYDECFVGSAAVDWFERELKLAREQALQIGVALSELGYFYHVTRDQSFLDGKYFYRVSADTARLNELNLAEVVSQMRSPLGVGLRDRKYHGTVYPECFVGSDAVAWLHETYALSDNEAMTLGQRLIDLFVIHHVVDSQPFRNGKFFYRFFEDEP